MVRKTTRLSSRSSTMRMFDRSSGVAAPSAVSSWEVIAGTGTLMVRASVSALQPSLENAQELLAVDRLGQIVPCPGLDAALTVPFHRLGGHRDDRQVLALLDLSDLAPGFEALHLPHHYVP